MNARKALWVAAIAGAVIAPAPLLAQGAFSRGFEMGNRAYEQGAASARSREQQRRDAQALRERYGTPELDRLDALERSADRWAEEVAQMLARLRERGGDGAAR